MAQSPLDAATGTLGYVNENAFVFVRDHWLRPIVTQLANIGPPTEVGHPRAPSPEGETETNSMEIQQVGVRIHSSYSLVLDLDSA